MKKEEFSFRLLGIEFTGHKKRLFRLVLQVWAALIVILLISIFAFDYKMTSSDIPGGMISGILLAYLIHQFQE